jgi:hypothetical protein
MIDRKWNGNKIKVAERKSGVSKTVLTGLGLGWKWKKQTTPRQIPDFPRTGHSFLHVRYRLHFIINTSVTATHRIPCRRMKVGRLSSALYAALLLFSNTAIGSAVDSTITLGPTAFASLARRADEVTKIECDAAFCVKNLDRKCECGWYWYVLQTSYGTFSVFTLTKFCECSYPEDSETLGEACVNIQKTKTVTVGVVVTISKVMSETRIITEVVTTTQHVLTKTFTASPSGINAGVPGKVRRQLPSGVTEPASRFYHYATLTAVFSRITEEISQTTVESTTTSTATVSKITGTVFTTVTPSPTQQPSAGSAQNNKDNIPVIIGASIGGAGCIALIASVALFWRARNHKLAAADTTSKALMESSTPNSEPPGMYFPALKAFLPISILERRTLINKYRNRFKHPPIRLNWPDGIYLYS